TPGATWYTLTFMARVMVLMCGLELTLFAVVMLFWMPASTCAAVNEPDACGVVGEALAPWFKISMATARLAPARRQMTLREILPVRRSGFCLIGKLVV